MYQLVPN